MEPGIIPGQKGERVEKAMKIFETKMKGGCGTIWLENLSTEIDTLERKRAHRYGD